MHPLAGLSALTRRRFEVRDRGRHRLDVDGRRAAAAAYECGAQLHEAAGVPREVRRIGGVLKLPIRERGWSGIRLRGQGQCREPRQLSHDVEQSLRAKRAVRAERGHAQALQRRGDFFGRVATQRAAILDKGHLRNDRHLAQLTGHADRVDHLRETAERLE